jgi:hypothetical protein
LTDRPQGEETPAKAGRSYWHQVVAHAAVAAAGDTSLHRRRILVGASAAVVGTFLLGLTRGPSSAADYAVVALVSAASLGVVAAVVFMYRLLQTPAALHAAQDARVAGLDAEVARLRRRELDVAIEAEHEKLATIDLRPEALDHWVESRRRAMLRPLEEWEASAPPHVPANAAGIRTSKIMEYLQGDRRTPDAYRKAVEEWAEAARERLPLALFAAAVVHRTAVVRFTATNLTRRTFQNVAVRVLLPEEWTVDWLRYSWTKVVPREPALWGTDKGGVWGGPYDLSGFNAAFSVALDRGQIERTASGIEIRFPTFDFRPGDLMTFPKMGLMIPHTSAGQTGHARWRASAMGVDEWTEGSVMLTVTEEVWSPERLLVEPNWEKLNET